ncbi:hypothetical protein ACJX0J_031847, partial [Zea mays]
NFNIKFATKTLNQFRNTTLLCFLDLLFFLIFIFLKLQRSRATTDEWFLIQEHTDECVPSLESVPQQAQELQVNAVITQVLLHFTKIDIHLHTIVTSQDQKTSDDPVFFILCNSKKGNSSNCREGSSNNILKDGCSTLLTASIVSVIF